MQKILALIVAGFLAGSSAVAAACPLISGLVDSNCDQVLKIGFVGDSFVKGVGDRSELGGGYVSRVALQFPEAVVVKYPNPGIASGILYSKLVRRVPKMNRGPADQDLHDTDILIVDVGRNDYWEDNYPPRTVQNIRRIVKYLKEELSKHGKTAPIIAVTTLAPTNRRYQAGFIENVNFQLLGQRSASNLPVYLRMDKLRNSRISSDGLHPNSVGYQDMATIIDTYIEGKGQTRARTSCPDNDGDGIFDKFELSKYGTNPALLDTDNDLFPDGDEVFLYSTDPLDAGSHP